MANDDGCAICCVFFSTIISIVLYVLYIVYSIIILNDTNEAIPKCNQVWIYCLVTLILSVISSCMGKVAEKDEHGKPKDNSVTSLIGAISFGCFVWGCVIYSNLQKNSECLDGYKQDYHDLWILFCVVFWTNVAGLILVGLLLSCACCAICASGGGNSHSRMRV